MKHARLAEWVTASTAQLGGLGISCASRQQLVEALLVARMARRRGARGARLIFDANGHALSLAARHPAYAQALGQADLIHADGGFLVTLSRKLGGARIAERSATTDMIHDIARVAVAERISFYLLGGSEDVSARAAQRLRDIYPGIAIVGRHHGYFADSELAAILAEINALQPDVVWLGLGKPREQILAARIGPRLVATWLVTCGGCFDFVAGDVPRAPRWMQHANIEWLYRLLRDPRRLFWRYLITNPHALWLVLAASRTPRPARHALRRRGA